MRILLTITLLLMLQPLCAQDVFVSAMTGLLRNTGPEGREVNGSGRGQSTIVADVTAMGDDVYVQAGAGVGLLTVRGTVNFLFEEHILPDKQVKTYPASMASPGISAYGFINGKLYISKTGSYFFGGLRGGAIMFTNERTTEVAGSTGRNERSEVVLRSRNAPLYGVQVGFSTHNKKRVATGFCAAWQRFSTTADMNYDAEFYYKYGGFQQVGTQNIVREVPYSVNLFSLQVFIRYCLFEDKVKKTVRDNVDCPK